MSIAYDTISIDDVEFETSIGITDGERNRTEIIRISVVVELESVALASTTDDVKYTINYLKIIEEVNRISKLKPRKLIETLAEEIASYFLTTHEYEIRKIIVEVKRKAESPMSKNPNWVAVRIHRPVSTY
jgi:dihydroneopterin aldolase